MPLFRFAFEAMACGCEVVLASPTLEEAQRVALLAQQEVKRIELKYSRYRSDSVISRINQQAGLNWVECDQETLALFQFVDTLYQSSDGLFDITSGVLRHLWRFQSAELPSQASIDNALESIGWHKVERSATAVRLTQPSMELDFGGFGKEYAADRAGSILVQQGIRHGYVNLGGDMRVIGPKPDGAPWMMGIQHPRNSQEMIANIPIEYGALATSGDYERYFEYNGKRYCHILNPNTGWPVAYWQSVSVLAPMTVSAGSMTTIAMLKESSGLEFLMASGMSYLVVDHDGYLSSNQAD